VKTSRVCSILQWKLATGQWGFVESYTSCTYELFLGFLSLKSCALDELEIVHWEIASVNSWLKGKVPFQGCKDLSEQNTNK
jgi:hypothetical protein